MAKYNFEFKRKIVMEYLSGQGGYECLEKKYGVPHSVIRKWIHNYKCYGEESLRRSRQQQSYSWLSKSNIYVLAKAL